MNRYLNLISNILVIGFALLAFLYYNQDFGLELIIFKEVTIFFPIILLLIGLFKGFSRWQKIKLTKKKEGFKISKSGWIKAVTYETLPFFIFIPLSIMLLFYLPLANLFVVVLYILILEGLFFLFTGKKAFKIIVNDQALIIINNQQYFLFWDKIKNISFQQKGMIILMKTKRQIYIGESDYEDFPNWKESIKNEAIAQGIYIQN
tara:strand:- start:1387 stop:2001 length:615 start_codon:yes stop_codon:yes gene_type:complete